MRVWEEEEGGGRGRRKREEGERVGSRRRGRGEGREGKGKRGRERGEGKEGKEVGEVGFLLSLPSNASHIFHLPDTSPSHFPPLHPLIPHLQGK